MQTGRLGQVREIAAGPKAGTHARTLRLITATGRRLPHQMAGADTRTEDPLTGTARINHLHARVRRATRMHRPTTIAEAAAHINRRHALARQTTRTRHPTTIVEAAALINRQPDLIPRRPAVTRRRRALILRRPTQRLRALTRPPPTQHLRALTPPLAAAMGAVEEARLTAEVVAVVDRMAAALTAAVLTDAKNFRPKARSK